jgi:rhodanese-related sulfurtransferase
MVGVVLGAIGNAVSGRGLYFTRDYFPKQDRGSTTTPANSGNGTAASQPVSADGETDVLARISEQLRELGLQPIGFEEAKSVFEDPAYEAENMMFVDSRTEKSYAEGHIPGAYLFNRFRHYDYIDAVREAAEMAIQIVVYCGGGECEDSEETAVTLQELGLDPEILFIYVGGMEEWQNKGMPVECGERGSGEIIGGDQ